VLYGILPINPNSYGLSSNQTFSRQNNDSSQSASQQKRQKRDDNFRERKPFTIETCWTCGIKGHSRAQCNESSHPDRNQENVPFTQSAIGKRWVAKFPSRPVCDSTRRLDGPLVAPNPNVGTCKRISFSYDSNKSYLSYQKIKSYVTSLNNSSLSDFLFFTILPFRKDLLLTEAEVVDQIEEVQEVEMEVQEVEEEADSLHAGPNMVAGKDIRVLLDTGCLVGDCISKKVVDSLNASDLLFDVATTICSGFNN
jgi:hypothetical protein